MPATDSDVPGRSASPLSADALADAIRTLAKADVVAFGGVGFANQVLPVTLAYQDLARRLPNDDVRLRPHLDRLLAEGSPAGRVYAASLLARLDPPTARSAWQALAADRAEITTFNGCVMNTVSLAEYAGAELSRI